MSLYSQKLLLLPDILILPLLRLAYEPHLGIQKNWLLIVLFPTQSHCRRMNKLIW